jgi:hypothetical protein
MDTTEGTIFLPFLIVYLLPLPIILFRNVLQGNWQLAEKDCNSTLPHFSCAMLLAASRSHGARDAALETV